jgi:hypothetical protein
VRAPLASYEQNSEHCSATPSSDKICELQVPTVKAALASYKQKSVHCSVTPSSDKFVNCSFPTVKAAVASRIVCIFAQRHLVTNL